VPPRAIHAIHAVVGTECGRLGIPAPNYLTPSSFGSLEPRERAGNEHIGQKIDYSEAEMTRTSS
jgi:hypothetical protein